ncbi:MAG: hypothetical protein PHY40_04240 [Patescibacteria group bacterium]|nr:hypothetical protein [Patescibacteria group bacterium]
MITLIAWILLAIVIIVFLSTIENIAKTLFKIKEHLKSIDDSLKREKIEKDKKNDAK